MQQYAIRRYAERRIAEPRRGASPTRRQRQQEWQIKRHFVTFAPYFVGLVAKRAQIADKSGRSHQL